MSGIRGEEAWVDELWLVAAGRECGMLDRDTKMWLSLRTVLRACRANDAQRPDAPASVSAPPSPDAGAAEELLNELDACLKHHDYLSATNVAQKLRAALASRPTPEPRGRPGGPEFLTPEPGETAHNQLSRILAGWSWVADEGDRIELTEAFAQQLIDEYDRPASPRPTPEPEREDVVRRLGETRKWLLQKGYKVEPGYLADAIRLLSSPPSSPDAPPTGGFKPQYTQEDMIGCIEDCVRKIKAGDADGTWLATLRAHAIVCCQDVFLVLEYPAAPALPVIPASAVLDKKTISVWWRGPACYADLGKPEATHVHIVRASAVTVKEEA